MYIVWLNADQTFLDLSLSSSFVFKLLNMSLIYSQSFFSKHISQHFPSHDSFIKGTGAKKNLFLVF